MLRERKIWRHYGQALMVVNGSPVVASSFSFLSYYLIRVPGAYEGTRKYRLMIKFNPRRLSLVRAP
jgi:hypothetical protein